MSAGLTDCGLPGVRQIPYGVHMCHFYEGRDDLAAALVPYFTAGLRCNERCIWITSAPLNALEAKLELGNAGVDVEAEIARGALIVRDYSQWYVEAGRLRATEIVALWLQEEERALAAGFCGLRITGNVSFLASNDWPEFMAYESAVNETFPGRRIVTLCTYPAGGCGASEVLDVVHRHSCTLDHPDEGWQILTRSVSGFQP